MKKQLVNGKLVEVAKDGEIIGLTRKEKEELVKDMKIVYETGK